MLPVYSYYGAAEIHTKAGYFTLPMEFDLILSAETNQKTFEMAMKALSKTIFDSNYGQLYNAIREAGMEDDGVLGNSPDGSSNGHYESNGSEPSS